MAAVAAEGSTVWGLDPVLELLVEPFDCVGGARTFPLVDSLEVCRAAMCSTARCCHSRPQSDLGAWDCSSVLSRHPHPLARPVSDTGLGNGESPSLIVSGLTHA